MEAAAVESRKAGDKPYVIPIGASTAARGGRLRRRGFGTVHAVPGPVDVIVHASSSGGTQAGLIAGCSARQPRHPGDRHERGRVGGVAGTRSSRTLLTGIPPFVDAAPERFDDAPIEVDDRFVGGGYGVPTVESQEAIELLARSEALFLDPTYTAKAMAGLIARVRAGEFPDDQTVLFWHTGGQVGLFA